MTAQRYLSIIRSAVFAAFSAAALLLTHAAQTAHAQGFPSKPIKIVVPFGAAGVADLTARAVSQKLSEQLGVSVVVENRPGAGGVLASDLVAKSAPDGHTLLLMSNANAVSAGLFKTLPYDALNDFAPISLLGTFDLAILVAADSKFKTLAELVAFARANPGKLNVGTINVGSTQNLSAELFKTSGKLAFQVVAFNGSPAVMTALRGGQVDVAFEILGPALGQIKSGTVRALAVTGVERAAALPDVPTVTEAKVAGLAAYTVSSWNALAAPAKTPADVVAKLQREVVIALANTELRKRLTDLNVSPKPSSTEQAKALLERETRHWGAVIERAGIAKQ